MSGYARLAKIIFHHVGTTCGRPVEKLDTKMLSQCTVGRLNKNPAFCAPTAVMSAINPSFHDCVFLLVSLWLHFLKQYNKIVAEIKRSRLANIKKHHFSNIAPLIKLTNTLHIIKTSTFELHNTLHTPHLREEGTPPWRECAACAKLETP